MSFFSLSLSLSLSQCPEQSKHTCVFTILIFRNIVETFLLQKLCFGFFSLSIRPPNFCYVHFISYHFIFLFYLLCELLCSITRMINVFILFSSSLSVAKWGNHCARADRKWYGVKQKKTREHTFRATSVISPQFLLLKLLLSSQKKKKKKIYIYFKILLIV